jgi:putative hydrolase of the HAD superfamily
MARPQAVLFDAGETLFREVPARQEIYAAAAREFGLEVDAAQVGAAMRAAHETLPREIEGHFRYTEGWFRTFIESVFIPLGLTRDIERLQERLIGTFGRADTFVPFDETRAVLKRLKGAGLKLAVVSNWSPRLPALLSGLGLAGDFQVIVSSSILRAEKPEPAIFRRALEQLGLEAERCLHVGDHPVKDYAGARALCIQARLLDRERRYPRHPDRIESLSEILDLFELPRI